MLLFNAFSSGRNGIPSDYPTIAVGAMGRTRSAAPCVRRQSDLRFKVRSRSPAHKPTAKLLWISLAYTMKTTTRPGFEPAFSICSGLRQGSVLALRSQLFRREIRPLLRQVIYPALWGAGNLWLWLPQARLEQKFASAARKSAGRADCCKPTTSALFLHLQLLFSSRARAWETRVAVGTHSR